LKKEILILNYHQIDNGNYDDSSALDKIYAVRDTAFKEQVDALLSNKIPVVSLNDIYNDTIDASFAVSITADDGNNSDYEVIYPLLNKHNIPATFFLLTNKNINWSRINEMIGEGFSVGSHGISHCDLTKLSRSELRMELEQSKKLIEDKTNQAVDFFSLPFGLYNQKVMAAGREAGYKALLTTTVRLNDPKKNRFILHRWSIKRTTSLEEFEHVLLSRKRLKRKIYISTLKSALRKKLGKSISDQLNLIFNKP